MKKMKKSLSVILAVLMMATSLAVVDFSAFASTTTGKVGQDVSFSYDTSNRALTITGTGAMDDVYYDEDWQYYDNEDYGFYDFLGNVKTVVVGEGVTHIGNYAFAEMYELKAVTLPSTLISIGNDAFNGDLSLEAITIPSAVTSIGEGAFAGTALYSFVVESGNTVYKTLDGVLFNASETVLIAYPSQKNTTSYTIPSTVTTIIGYAFQDSQNLKTITFPSSVTTIGEGAFSWCYSLSAIKNFPTSITKIPDYCFSGTSFTSFTISNKVKEIGEGAFCYTDLTSISIPSSVEVIDDAAFAMCMDLKKAVVPASVTSIGESAFYTLGDSKLKMYVYKGTIAESYAKENESDEEITLVYRAVSGLKYSKSTSSVKLSWSALAGASGYKIYKLQSNGSYKLVKTLSGNNSTSIKFTKLSDGTVRTYRVVPYQTVGTKKYNGGVKSIKTTTLPKTVKIKKVSSSRKTVSVTYALPSGSKTPTGYEARVSTKKSFNSNVKTKYVSNKNKSMSVSGLKSGKKYYVQVRAYKTVNGKKVYGAWSTTSSIKCK